ncbi:discoidin domain-containing receptor 2-like [Athalia rosae]|uniref:discoidin domain-containing receptor 2-like n=1 Tax=Athalia rosae TaxID=37344 RepID=UPI0020349860|nr:discoidin domain-containing receptor 2-like [Athalia rosae]XP_048507991.1 discoidin domain-containing receptor 2-like [Athalia rosae]
MKHGDSFSTLANYRYLCVLFTLLWLGDHVTSINSRSCNSPLGMESGDIPDSAVNASSSYVTNVGPRYARLRKETAGGAWCPKRQIEAEVREWLLVDLGGSHLVRTIQTQGRYDHGRGQEYVEEYTVEYWRPGFSEWREYRRWDDEKILTGNTDTATVVSQEMVPPIIASKIRLLPHSVHRRTVCLRIELKGCPETSGVVNYAIPESPVTELSDTLYDGRRQHGVLFDGLGRLMDGEIGADDYRIDMGYGKGTSWVAWMSDSFPTNYVELVFEFDEIKVFHAVHLYANNYFSRDVQVFSKAKIWFSVGGQFYNGRPLSYSYMPDTVLENARNVTIGLHGRSGRFVKLHLHFGNRWIMISEVTFETSSLYDNTTEEVNSEANAGGNEVPGNSELDLTLQTITAREKGQEYVEVLIGVLTAITLLLLLVFVIILLLSRRQKLQSSPTVLKNPFGFAVNMKGLLLNLTPSGMLRDNTHASPGAGEDLSMHESLTMEQFHSPLVAAQSLSYEPTYATVLKNASPETSKDLEDADEPEPPFQDVYEHKSRSEAKMDLTVGGGGERSPCGYSSPSFQNKGGSSVSRQQYSTSHSQNYRTLQSNSSGSSRALTNAVISSTSQRDLDLWHSKRWHTAPKEKHKIPAPVVCWNIAPSMSKPYKCKETEPTEIPRQCLRVTEKLGSSHVGEVFICETVGLDVVVPGSGKLVIARVPPIGDEERSAPRVEAMREVGFLANLVDPNLARIFGVCVADPGPWIILEYTELGDLAHYLRYSVPLTGTLRPSCNLKALSQSCLLYMGAQIASGMRFLESRNLVHKDLAARNCLLGRSYTVKVTDIAMCSDLYKKDYCDIGGRPPAPIRWLPWESILLDRYTCASSVWSFAVTFWEVMSLAREKPFQHLSNEQVIQNAELMYYGGELQVFLPKPTMCPDKVYKVMCSCWKRDETGRPSFKEICAFLSSVNGDFRPT